MKLDKLTVLKILGIAGAAIFFYWALQNLSLLADAAGWLLNILWPLLLGFCMAFVLNIPMRFFERHLLKNPKNKRAAALRRPLCILLSLLAIIVILTAVFALVVPELLSAFAVLGEAIPEFLTAAQKWALEGADRFPQAEQWLASLQIDWNETGKKLLSYVTEGAGALIETDGARREFRVGDAVIIPAGFKGIFEVTEPMKKHYVIIDRQEQIA